jgi:hypothetical protein
MTINGKKRKRAYIPKEAEAIILTHALEYPRLKRTLMAEKLQQELESRGYDVPEIEVLERKISRYRRYSSDSPLEKPWSIATLDDYPIPAQALPIVLEEYKQHIEEGTVLTIREAKWIARLSATKCKKSWPYWIARTEQLYELTGKSPDFEAFDRLLVGLSGQTNDLMSLFAAASLVGILKNDPTKKAAAERDKRLKKGGKE